MEQHMKNVLEIIENARDLWDGDDHPLNITDIVTRLITNEQHDTMKYLVEIGYQEHVTRSIINNMVFHLADKLGIKSRKVPVGVSYTNIEYCQLLKTHGWTFGLDNLIDYINREVSAYGSTKSDIKVCDWLYDNCTNDQVTVSFKHCSMNDWLMKKFPYLNGITWDITLHKDG